MSHLDKEYEPYVKDPRKQGRELFTIPTDNCTITSSRSDGHCNCGQGSCVRPFMMDKEISTCGLVNHDVKRICQPPKCSLCFSDQVTEYQTKSPSMVSANESKCNSIKREPEKVDKLSQKYEFSDKSEQCSIVSYASNMEVSDDNTISYKKRWSIDTENYDVPPSFHKEFIYNSESCSVISVPRNSENQEDYCPDQCLVNCPRNCALLPGMCKGYCPSRNNLTEVDIDRSQISFLNYAEYKTSFKNISTQKINNVSSSVLDEIKRFFTTPYTKNIIPDPDPISATLHHNHTRKNLYGSSASSLSINKFDRNRFCQSPLRIEKKKQRKLESELSLASNKSINKLAYQKDLNKLTSQGSSSDISSTRRIQGNTKKRLGSDSSTTCKSLTDFFSSSYVRGQQQAASFYRNSHFNEKVSNCDSDLGLTLQSVKNEDRGDDLKNRKIKINEANNKLSLGNSTSLGCDSPRIPSMIPPEKNVKKETQSNPVANPVTATVPCDNKRNQASITDVSGSFRTLDYTKNTKYKPIDELENKKNCNVPKPNPNPNANVRKPGFIQPCRRNVRERRNSYKKDMNEVGCTTSSTDEEEKVKCTASSSSNSSAPTSCPRCHYKIHVESDTDLSSDTSVHCNCDVNDDGKKHKRKFGSNMGIDKMKEHCRICSQKEKFRKKKSSSARPAVDSNKSRLGPGHRTEVKDKKKKKHKCYPSQEKIPGCSCRFPPVFNEYVSCTGHLAGNCCCCDNKRQC